MNFHIGVFRMFEQFLFCFKQKTGAILMAYMSMVFGSIGLVYFVAKMHLNYAKSDSHFLVIAVFHIAVSAILLTAVIWEKPLLVLIYEFMHLSVLASLLAFVIIYSPHCPTFWAVLGSCTGIALYWLCCIHIYYRQLRLKLKSHLDYISRDVYSVCNRLYENKNVYNLC